MLAGDRIQARRQHHGMTQQALGSHVDKDAHYISKLERGVLTTITTVTLEKLADSLDCTTDYLLGRAEVPKPDAPPLRGSRPPVSDLRQAVAQMYTELDANLQNLEGLLIGIGSLRFLPGVMMQHARNIRRGMTHLQELLKGAGVRDVTPMYKTEFYAEVKAMERLLRRDGTQTLYGKSIVEHVERIRQGLTHLQQILTAHHLLDADFHCPPIPPPLVPLDPRWLK